MDVVVTPHLRTFALLITLDAKRIYDCGGDWAFFTAIAGSRDYSRPSLKKRFRNCGNVLWVFVSRIHEATKNIKYFRKMASALADK